MAKIQKKSSKAKPMQKLLPSKIKGSCSFIETTDDGKCVVTYLTGYTNWARQVLLRSIFIEGLEEPSYDHHTSKEIRAHGTGEPLVEETLGLGRFELELVRDKTIYYDKNAVEVRLVASKSVSELWLTAQQHAPAGMSREIFIREVRGRNTKDGQYSYSLGYIPKDHNISRAICGALTKGQLSTPHIMSLTNRAPKKGESTVYGIKIVIPYGKVIKIGKNFHDLDSEDTESSLLEMNDMMEMI